MNRAYVLVLGMSLLMVPSVVAQKSGAHGAGGPGGKAEAPAPELKDFNLALGLQATPAQTEQFKSLAKSTGDAHTELDALLQSQSGELSPHANALKQAVDQIGSEKNAFVGNLTDAQKSGLKDRLKKLSKAESEMTKAWKALDPQLNGSDKQRITGAAQRFKQALENYQTEQRKLAAEMGITADGSSTTS